MEKNNQYLGTEPLGKLLFKLAVPSVVAQIINMLYNIVDRIYIGHMPEGGSLALTGLGVCMPIIMVVSAFAALVSMGGAPRASIAMGRGDNSAAERILGNCFILQIIISAILTSALLIWDRDLLLAFGASPDTIGFAAGYMDIYALGTISVQLNCQRLTMSSRKSPSRCSSKNSPPSRKSCAKKPRSNKRPRVSRKTRLWPRFFMPCSI